MSHGGNLHEIQKKYNISREKLIDFSANINPLGVPEAFKNLMIDTIDDLVNYPDINYNDLKSAIGEKYKLSFDDIYVGNGGIQVIFDFIKSIKPKKALVVEPTFCEYRRALNTIDCQIQQFYLKEENKFVLDMDELIKEIDEGLDLIIICNPNNPTGTLIDKMKLLTLVKECKKKSVYLMIDEAFMDFVDDEEAQSLLRECQIYHNLMISRSFTKFYGVPGLRIGFGVCSNEKVKNQLSNSAAPWMVNTFASSFGKVLLEETNYEKRTRQWLKQETQFLLRELNSLNLFKVYQPSANFILLKMLNQELSVKILKDKLLEKHILIRDCSNFVGLDESYLRIAIKCPEANKKLVAALSTLSTI